MKKMIFLLILATALTVACVACVPDGESEGKGTGISVTTVSPTDATTAGNGSTTAMPETTDWPIGSTDTMTANTTATTENPVVELPKVPF